MRPMVFHLFVAASIVCRPLAAQEPRTETNSGVAEQFKRFDRDGNGRLSASEAGKAEFFRRADADEDGAGRVGTPRMNAGLDVLDGTSLSLRRACDCAIGVRGRAALCTGAW